jgi:hypothetical protein
MRATLFVVLAGFAIGSWPFSALGQVVISEFMASSSRTLADEDGEFPDWIELHNTGAVAVNLLDWSLTDNPAALTQWRFPATNLVAGGRMVVFASGKNRRVAGAPLHTDFRLSADGEYLALVEPGGMTIAAEFSPAFPPQVTDVSFGLDPGLRPVTLLASNAVGRLLVPGDGALGTNWALPGFDDSSWHGATSAVGFAVGALGLLPLPGLTSNLVGYWKFDETNGLIAAEATGRSSNGTLMGFPANNSQWVAGRNDGGLRFRGSPDFVRAANYPKATNALTVSAWVFAEARPTWASIAKNWGGALAGQFHFGLRDTAGDLDIFVHTSTGDFSVRENVLFPTGSWQHVAFTAEAGTLRLFRNGRLVASGPYSGNFLPSATAPLGIGVKLNDAGNAADTGAPGYWRGSIDDLAIWNRALATSELAVIHAAAGGPFRTDARGLMLGSNATCYLRFPFVVDNPDVLTRWRLKMRYDDGFVAWLNGEEVVRRNAPELPGWNSTADSALAELSGAFEEINLSAFEESVVAGTNILAIQGLNASKDDPDFLVEPGIEALSITNTTNALVYFTTPTPGADNVVGVSVLGPIIGEVAHTPQVPLDGEDLLVTARVAPALAAVTNVTMRYRVMFSNEVALPMFDDGAHGDGAAGDRVFGATIPASASTNGQMVRYLISATDSLGRVSRAPLFNDPQNSDEYFGTIVQNPAITTPLPVFHWFLATPTAAETDAGTRCSLFYNGEFYDNIFVRIRGGTARAWPKKSYKVEFNEDHEFLLRPGERRVTEFDWNATYTDKAYVRAVLTAEHQRAVGLPTPEIFHMHLRQNTAFYSVALYTENVDRDFLIRTGMDENGALYKGGPGSTGDTVSSFEKKTRRTENNQDLQAFLSGLALTGTALENFVFDNIDLPEVINYMATMAVTQDIDGTDKNHFLHRDTEGSREWRLLPWDLDLTFGPDALNTDTIVYQLQNVPAPACASHPFIGARPYLLHAGKYQRLIEAMVNTPRTRAMILRRTRTLTEQFLTTTWFQDRIEQLYPLLLADVTADRARWGGNAHFGGTTYTLRAALDRIKNEYLTPRPGYLLGTNIAGVGLSNALKQPFNVRLDIAGVEFNPPSGNQAQEYVCLTNPTPFALDISGWRVTGGIDYTFAPGTVIPSNSVLYLSPDVATFRARTTNPRGGQGLFVQGGYRGQLSARGETLRVLNTLGTVVSAHSFAGSPSPAQQYLRITELMYHPSLGVPALAGTSAEDYEFIELKNVSTNITLNLAGVRFVNGVEFDFTGSAVTSLAPGQTMLVVRNPVAFAARYGNGFNIAGQYVGTLENQGERVQLVDSAGEEILDFSYDNDWYPITDGFGFSLVAVDEKAEPDAWGRQSQWRASGTLGGSPLGSDAAPPAIPGVVINEVLSRSDVPPPLDTIELLNDTQDAADVSGWYLTDDFNTPKKFRIPNGTIIGGGQVVAFDESHFNPGGNGFALSSDGDEVWLFSANAAGDLTGYVHGFAFGPAENGVPFGRREVGPGDEHFVALGAFTPGAQNAAPRIGPLVITEIMFHPPDFPDGSDNSADEFIELLNIGVLDLPLFDPAIPTNRWRLSGGVDFVFPAGTTLAAGEHVLLVNFNPTNGTLLAAFRAKYGVSATVRVFGSYGGKLGNDGDTVQIEKPTTPLGGSVPYVLVDRVRYRDAAPWPAGADGSGLSLHRRNASHYGDDPGIWLAKLPGAGTSITVFGSPPIIVSQPQSQTVVAFQDAMFAVSAEGLGTLRYQWRFNRENISGATNFALFLNDVQPEQAGEYDVIVHSDDGSTVSSNATLTLRYPASILQPPGNVQVRVRPDPQAAPVTNSTFSVLAYSTSPLSYQWRFNGDNIPGATGSALTISNVQVTNGGNYTVLITDETGSTLSAPAALIPLVSPVIIQGLVPQTVAAGATVTFSVAASGSPMPFGYEWRRGSVVVASNVVHSATNFYTFIASTVPFTTNQYRVIVRNLANLGINANSLSTNITLPDFDQDGIIDAYEQSIGLNTNNAADALSDLDNDQMNNRAEFLAGTDPANAASYLRVDLTALPNQAFVQIAAVSNRTYTVQYTDAVGSAPWFRLADIIARPTNHLEMIADPAWTTNRFYRLILPAQP